jgi:hypothetical protein
MAGRTGARRRVLDHHLVGAVGSDVEEDVAGLQRVHEELHEDGVLFVARARPIRGAGPGRLCRTHVTILRHPGILWFGLLR